MRPIAGFFFVVATAMVVAGCASAYPRKLTALGTEPFWSFKLNGSRASYEALNHPGDFTGKVARTEANGQLRVTGELGGTPLDMTVTRAKCSDGMSDRTYPYDVSLTVLGERLTGCASPN